MRSLRGACEALRSEHRSDCRGPQNSIERLSNSRLFASFYTLSKTRNDGKAGPRPWPRDGSLRTLSALFFRPLSMTESGRHRPSEVFQAWRGNGGIDPWKGRAKRRNTSSTFIAAPTLEARCPQRGDGANRFFGLKKSPSCLRRSSKRRVGPLGKKRNEAQHASEHWPRKTPTGPKA